MSESQPVRMFEDKHLLFLVGALCLAAWDYHDSPYLQRGGSGWNLSIPTAQQPAQPAPAVSAEALSAAAPVRAMLGNSTTDQEIRALFREAAKLISRTNGPVQKCADIQGLWGQVKLSYDGSIGPPGLDAKVEEFLKTRMGGMDDRPLDGEKPLRQTAVDSFNAMGTE